MLQRASPKIEANPVTGALESAAPALLEPSKEPPGVRLLGPLRGHEKMFAAAFYFVMAVAMGFVNKAALNVFPYGNTLLMVQMGLTLAAVRLAKVIGLVSVRPLRVADARTLLPLAFFYNANVVFSLAGLNLMNIPMYQTLKRLTPCVVCIVNGLAGRGWVSRNVAGSVLLVCVGTLVAGIGDFNFNVWAYTYAFLSCLFQAAYLILVESGSEKGFSSTELMQYNAALSLPVLVVLVGTLEWSRSFPALVEQSLCPKFLSLVLLASSAGAVLNYALFLCAGLNSALTTTIIGVLKAVAMTALGFVLLGGARVTPMNFTGICLNSTGGVLYTYYKHMQKMEAKRSSAASAAPLRGVAVDTVASTPVSASAAPKPQP